MSNWLPADRLFPLLEQAEADLWGAGADVEADTLKGHLQLLREQAREFPDVPEGWDEHARTYYVGPEERMVDIERAESKGFIVSYQNAVGDYVSILHPETRGCQIFPTVGEAIAAVTALLEAGK